MKFKVNGLFYLALAGFRKDILNVQDQVVQHIVRRAVFVLLHDFVEKILAKDGILEDGRWVHPQTLEQVVRDNLGSSRGSVKQKLNFETKYTQCFACCSGKLISICFFHNFYRGSLFLRGKRNLWNLQGNEWYTGANVTQLPQLQVITAKIMAPFWNQNFGWLNNLIEHTR